MDNKIKQPKNKKIRSDKKRARAKVIKSILNNPLKSQRDIAKEVNMSKSSVNRTIKDMRQNGTLDERLEEICDLDIDIIKKWLNIINDRFTNNASDVTIKDVVSAIDSWTRRNLVFRPKKEWEDKWPIIITRWV